MRLLSLLAACAMAFPAFGEDAPPAEAPPSAPAADAPAASGDPVVAIAKGEVRSAASPAAARGGALLKLGEMRHPEALAVLSAALSDPDLSIRIAAVKGLRLLGDPAAVKSIAPLVGEAKVEQLPVKAAYDRVDLLDADLKVERGTPLEDATAVDRNLDLRREAALTLGRLGSADGVEALIGCLSGAPPELAAAAVESLEILANCRLEAGEGTSAEAWAAWWSAHRGSDRDAWALEGFQAHFKKAGRDLADLASPASIQVLAVGLLAEEPWIRSNAQERILAACDRAQDEAAMAPLLDALLKAAREETAFAKPRDPAKEAAKSARTASARRSLARTFLRLALRYARLKGLSPKERPFEDLVTQISPSAGKAAAGASFDPLDPLCDWWSRTRSR